MVTGCLLSFDARREENLKHAPPSKFSEEKQNKTQTIEVSVILESII